MARESFLKCFANRFLVTSPERNGSWQTGQKNLLQFIKHAKQTECWQGNSLGSFPTQHSEHNLQIRSSSSTTNRFLFKFILKFLGILSSAREWTIVIKDGTIENLKKNFSRNSMYSTQQCSGTVELFHGRFRVAQFIIPYIIS